MLTLAWACAAMMSPARAAGPGEPAACDYEAFRDAIARGDGTRVERLLGACRREGGALPLREDGGDLLALAAHVGGREAPRWVERLLAAGADARHRAQDGMTPLRMAARFGCGDCVASLLAAGADLHERDVEGLTLLHEAGGSAVPALIAAGLDPSLRDAAGNVPLHRRWHPALLSVGVNVRNAAGLTPLHVAAFEGSVGWIDQLLAAGADPSARSTAATYWRASHMSRAFGPGEPVAAGVTPLDVAREQQRRTRWSTGSHDSAVQRLEAVTPRSGFWPWSR